MLRVTTTGWRRCETLESMSALLCHQKGTFSGNRSLLCAVDGILCDSACGEYASRFAGEVVLAARQPVASLRLLRRKPLLYFHPSFFQRGWINCPELPWDLHLISVLSGQRLLSAIWPVTWFTGLRTEYWILPGGIPSFTINIPKAKTLFRERWWERFFFLCCMVSQRKNVVFPWTSWWPAVGVNLLELVSQGSWSSGAQGHNLEEFLISWAVRA